MAINNPFPFSSVPNQNPATPGLPPKKGEVPDFNNRIFLLPGESSRVIVQYAPLFCISAVIPAQERDIHVDEHSAHIIVKADLKVKTPELVLMQTGYAHKNTLPEFHLYALKTSVQNKALMLKSFLLANIHPGGSICWGEKNVVPENLRHANNNFWRAPFNMDLWSGCPGGPKNHRCLLIAHKCSGEWDHHCQNVGMCDIQHICRKLGKCRISHECENARLDKNGNRYAEAPCPVENECDCCRGFCACSSRCQCCNTVNAGTSYCSCQVMCACCSGVCNCKCDCRCCIKSCKCPCQCNIGQVFLHHLQSYDPNADQTTGRNPQVDGNVWIDGTKMICGLRFVSTPEHYDAVFVSDVKEVVEMLPEKARRTWKNPRGGARVEKPFLVGFANKQPDNGWEITVTDNDGQPHKISLPKEKCQLSKGPSQSKKLVASWGASIIGGNGIGSPFGSTAAPIIAIGDGTQPSQPSPNQPNQ